MRINTELFDDILSTKYQGICPQCGHHRTHRNIYCLYCGTKYIQDITLLKGMKILNGISKSMWTSVTYDIGYVVACNKRRVVKSGRTISEFRAYIEQKVKE